MTRNGGFHSFVTNWLNWKFCALPRNTACDVEKFQKQERER